MKLKIYNSRKLRLIGNLNSVSANKIVILVHGFTNDRSSDGRFDRIALELNGIGYDTLAFDFSGSGESDDDELSFGNQRDDLKCVIDFLTGRGYKEIALFGNSFGTLSCLSNYRSEIKKMVLVGALTDSMIYDWNSIYSEEQLEELENSGYFYDKSERKHKISKQTLVDFENIIQDELIKNVMCPVMIIHGNSKEDEEELELLLRSKVAIEKLPRGSELKIVEGGKHGMHKHWDEVIELTSSWYKSRF